MKSTKFFQTGESSRPTYRAHGHRRFALLLLSLSALRMHANAQTPGGITSTPLSDFAASVSVFLQVPAVIDAAGNVYTIAYTGSPTPGAAQTLPGGGTCVIGGPGQISRPCSDAQISKLDPTGKAIYTSLLGGPGDEAANALAIDASGNVYATGLTTGSLPTTPNAAITSASGRTSFVAKLSPDGSHFLYVTYLPSTVTSTTSIRADALGNAYIAGTVGDDVCVIKIASDGTRILYNKVIGGSGRDWIPTLTADDQGNVFLAAETNSTDFPVTEGALQSKLKGIQNGVLMKLDPTGNVIFSTYLGGSGEDLPRALALDSAGDIYIAGATTSSDFPTTPGTMQPDPIVPSWSRSPGGFLAKLSPDGSKILYSTYVRSYDNNSDRPGVEVLAVTTAGDAYITGSTSVGFPVTASAPQLCAGLGVETFVAHLDSKGALLDATYSRDSQIAQVLALRANNDSSVTLISGTQRAGGSMSQLRFGDPNAVLPPCLASGVLNGTTLYPDVNIAPGQFVSFTGVGIGPDQGIGFVLDEHLQAPRKLGGVEVFFDGMPAPVLYAQSKQVNAQVPFELKGKTSTTVTLRYNGQEFGPLTARVGPAAPGLFRRQPDVGAQALAVNQDGTENSPANPAPVGSVVALWASGYGPVDPACGTGMQNADNPVNLAAGMIAGVTGVEDSWPLQVRYQGGAPHLLCGVVQINVQIPAGTPPGTRFYRPYAQTGTPTDEFYELTGAAISVK